MKPIQLIQMQARVLKNFSAAVSDSVSQVKKFARALPVALMALSACSTSPQGRMQITSPAPVSNLYSEADMRMHLVTVPSIRTPCVGVECEINRKFDLQVQQLGARLAAAAFEAYPELIKRVSHFEFVVEEKADFGSTSNASGKVVIFRGIQKLEPGDAMLSFLIAREMGHVIAKHHDENSATRILFTVAVGALFPALHLFSSTAAAAQAASATSTTMATAAASSATSYLGSKAVLASIKPGQLSEADAIALILLENIGWDQHEVAVALETSTHVDGNKPWEEDFRHSVNLLKMLDEDAQTAAYNLANEPIALLAEQEELKRSTEAEKESPAVSELQAGSTEKPVVETSVIEAAQEVKLESVAMAAPAQPAAQTIAVAEVAKDIHGGWEPAQPEHVKKVSADASRAKLSLLSASKITQPGKAGISVSKKRKTAAKIASRKRTLKLRLATPANPGSMSKKLAKLRPRTAGRNL